MTEPNAQGTQPEQNPAAVENQQASGVQQRIDELTREKHEAQRRAEELSQQYMTLLNDLATKSIQPQSAQPQVEIDPTLKAQMEAVMAPFQAQLNRTLAQIQQAQALTNARSLAGSLPEPVAQEMQKVVSDYAKQGYRVDDEVALDIAYGRVARKQQTAQGQANQAQRQFNSQTPVIGQQSMMGIPQVPQTNKPNLDAMTFAERQKYWDTAPALPL